MSIIERDLRINRIMNSLSHHRQGLNKIISNMLSNKTNDYMSIVVDDFNNSNIAKQLECKCQREALRKLAEYLDVQTKSSKTETLHLNNETERIFNELLKIK